MDDEELADRITFNIFLVELFANENMKLIKETFDIKLKKGIQCLIMAYMNTKQDMSSPRLTAIKLVPLDEIDDIIQSRDVAIEAKQRVRYGSKDLFTILVYTKDGGSWMNTYSWTDYTVHIFPELVCSYKGCPQPTTYARKKCGRCRIRYCAQKCQEADWEQHKKNCNKEKVDDKKS